MAIDWTRAGKVVAATIGGLVAVQVIRSLLARGGSAGGTPAVVPPAPASAGAVRPPNISGDPKGWNTTLWENDSRVAWGLARLGYPESLASARAFQTDWNRVVKAIRAGTLPVHSATRPELAKAYRGTLREDNKPGRNTKNAMEIAWRNQADLPGGNGNIWTLMVKAV